MSPVTMLVTFTGCFVLLQLWLRRQVGPMTRPRRNAADGDDSAVHPVERLLLALLVGGFVLLELPGITGGLHYDELYTASNFVVGRTLWQAASGVSAFNNHIAYSLLAGLAIRILGTAEWVLRMPAMLCGAATIVALWKLARSEANRFVALIAAAVLATSPFFVAFAPMARGYSGLILMSVLSTYNFLEVLRRPSVGAAWRHGIANVLAVYFHLYGLWILATQYILFGWLVLRYKATPRPDDDPTDPAALRLLCNSFAGTAVVLTLLHLPVVGGLAAAVVGRGRTSVRQDFFVEVYRSFVATPSTLLGLGIIAIAVLGLRRVRPFVAAYIALSLGVPLFVMGWLVRPLDLYARFFVFWTPMFALLVANGIPARRTGAATLTNGLAFAAQIACGVVIAVLMVEWVAEDLKPSPLPDYRALLRSTGPEQGWRTYAAGGDSEMFEYYLPKPFEVLQSEADLDRALHDNPQLQVAYHDKAWNTAEDRQIADSLRRRCSTQARPPVVIFRCGP